MCPFGHEALIGRILESVAIRPLLGIRWSTSSWGGLREPIDPESKNWVRFAKKGAEPLTSAYWYRPLIGPSPAMDSFAEMRRTNSKQELLLPFIGGIFVIEALSVILQVGSYKLRKKRIFKMAPLHHHFELLGWSESKVIVRFWVASLIFALFALTTLKLR